MSYPSAPWELKGYALQTLHLIDIDRARPLVPPDLEIVSVWPGKTVGGIYLSAYGSGSVLEYNEAIVVPALVSYGGQWGAWISHIYVDHEDSVAGGREIWGLPKERAEFIWETGASMAVKVSQSDRLFCSLTYTQPAFTLPLPLSGPVLSILDSDFLLFKGNFKSRMGLINGNLEIPQNSPFASLNLEQPLLTVTATICA
jgi:hypothetical protein